MKVAVFGLGYVGCTAVACIASQGHSVLGVDVSDAVRIQSITGYRDSRRDNYSDPETTSRPIFAKIHERRSPELIFPRNDVGSAAAVQYQNTMLITTVSTI